MRILILNTDSHSIPIILEEFHSDLLVFQFALLLRLINCCIGLSAIWEFTCKLYFPLVVAFNLLFCKSSFNILETGPLLWSGLQFYYLIILTMMKYNWFFPWLVMFHCQVSNAIDTFTHCYWECTGKESHRTRNVTRTKISDTHKLLNSNNKHTSKLLLMMTEISKIRYLYNIRKQDKIHVLLLRRC